jgi:uncharacterized protein YdeI (YjbR/CyaY-like superfamily)
MEATFFDTFADLYAWLEAHHDTATELWVGIYKKDAPQSGITYPQVVDAVLCFGWIDGIRQTIDDERWRIRITPRKRKSNWSAVNVRRINQLIEQGLVQPPGLAAFDARPDEDAQPYSYERQSGELPEEFAARFQEHASAWAFFTGQPPSYRKAAVWWVISAKQQATREKRLNQLIEDSHEGRRIKAVTYTKKS